MSDLTRRTLLATGLAGSTALIFTPAIARAQSASRLYRLQRGSTDIGSHSIEISRSGDLIEVQIDINIVVRVLGIPAYRYEMTNREAWSGGVLQSIRSTTNDDGDAAFVTANRTGDVIQIEGSGFTGTAGLESATTTYWTTAFLQRPKWINTQTGELLDITPSQGARVDYPTANSTVAATQWNVGPDLPATLHYTDAGEWAGSTFDARGTLVTYLAEGLTPAFAPIWSET